MFIDIIVTLAQPVHYLLVYYFFIIFNLHQEMLHERKKKH